MEYAGRSVGIDRGDIEMKASFIKGIDHVGYAVEDIDLASRQFAVLGFSFSEKMIDELRRVVVSVGEMTDVVENATKHEKSGISYYRGVES